MFKSLDNETINRFHNWATHIVVGCGAAGCVLAARLGENPSNRVLIVELGPNNFGNPWIETPAVNPLLWDNPDGPRPSPTSLHFETSMQLNRTYTYPRGNGFGGSINHHSMVDGWGSGKIYDQIAKVVGDDRWNSSNVAPFLAKMEHYYGPHPEYRGTQGWLKVRPGTIKAPFYADVIRAASEVTKAPVVVNTTSDGIHVAEIQVTPDGRRSSAFQDLLYPQIQKGNVVVLFNTLVTKVIFSGNRATGVEVIHHPHAYMVDDSARDSTGDVEKFHGNFFAEKEIILSGGAINTPQILLLSGIGPAEHLTEKGIPVLVDLPGVGTGLLDHHEVAVSLEIDPQKMVWPAQAANIIDRIDEALTQPVHREGLPELRNYLEQFADRQEQKESAGGVVLDWFSGMPTDIGHDLHVHCSEMFWFDFDFMSTNPLPNGKHRTDYFRSQTDPNHPEFMRVFQNFLIEVLRPSRADGTVRLVSGDPTIAPILDLGLYKDDEACQRMARGIQMVRTIARHPLLRQYYLQQEGEPKEIFPGPENATLDQLAQYVKRWSAFGHHISGTARMGRVDDKYAVVDSELRVIGTFGLRVVDTSVYPAPFLHGYNTSRGAYLIGEVAASFIR
jgi:choline dehydrogenase-like flavoprotein